MARRVTRRLYVLSTEIGGREDCSVLYAGYILVTSDDHDAVRKAIAEIIGAKQVTDLPTGNLISYDFSDEKRVTARGLAEQLVRRGFPARTVETDYVIGS